MTPNNERIIVIFITTPTKEASEQIARTLVEKKLVACVNVLPEIQSIYQWQGKIETSSEQLLLLKTTDNNFCEIERLVCEIHPYETPEILSIEASQLSSKYRQWVLDPTQVTL